MVENANGPQTHIMYVPNNTVFWRFSGVKKLWYLSLWVHVGFVRTEENGLTHRDQAKDDKRGL